MPLDWTFCLAAVLAVILVGLSKGGSSGLGALGMPAAYADWIEDATGSAAAPSPGRANPSSAGRLVAEAPTGFASRLTLIIKAQTT
jgi:hypothetical protein